MRWAIRVMFHGVVSVCGLFKMVVMLKCFASLDGDKGWPENRGREVVNLWLFCGFNVGWTRVLDGGCEAYYMNSSSEGLCWL